MFAISNNGLIAAAPLLAPTTKTNSLTIQSSTTIPTQVILPTCFNTAITQSKYHYDWFNDPDAPESEVNDPTLPQNKSIIEKKALENPFIRGLSWSIDNNWLGVSLDSYIFLLYQIIIKDNVIEAVLTTTIGLPRHLSFVTMTPNNKNWILLDALGDVYAFSHEKVSVGNKEQQQTLIFSVNTMATQAFPIVVGAKEYLLIADSESKIRVSNLPDFFNIQSYCMGCVASPTGIVSLKKTIKNDENIFTTQNSNIIITTTPGGYVRERIADPESGFLPYTPTETSILAHNIENGNYLLETFRINNENLFPSTISTQYSTAAYYGIGALYKYENGTNKSTLYVSPALTTCELDRHGHLNPSVPITYRTTIEQLICIIINADDDIDNTKFKPEINKKISINNLPSWFDIKNDLINGIISTDKQDTFFIQTITNKILELKQDGSVDKLTVVSSYDFSSQSIDPTTSSLPSVEEYQKRWEGCVYGVAKYINFHWRFELAPSKQAGQKRAHLAQALRGGDIVDEDSRDEKDGNEMVQLSNE